MNDLRRRVDIGALILAISSLGCGESGSDDGGKNIVPPQGCGTINPCGGDLTGTWKVLGGCSDALFSNGLLACPPNTPEELVGLGYAGTVTFNSNMTYTANFVWTGGESYAIPSSCMPGGVTCAEVNPLCSGGSSCTCSAGAAGASIIEGSGSYSIDGNQLIVSMEPNSSIAGIDYCVQGAFLHLETSLLIIQSDGTRIFLVTSDIVAQRQ